MRVDERERETIFFFFFFKSPRGVRGFILTLPLYQHCRFFFFQVPPRDKRAVHCEGGVNQTTKRNFMRGAVTN